ncbi:hypothetical protein KKG08_01305 [Patescibacteria group bacterium]|nr:hypothetical protein [Patescibacteria group bacterium]
MSLTRQKKQNQKPQSQTEAFQTLGLNLLSGVQGILSTPKETEDKISRYRKFILVISIFFGVLLISNYILDSKTNSLKERQEELTLKVLRYFQVEKDAKDIYERSSYYIHMQDEKQKILGKTIFVFENINSGVSLSRLRIDGEKFSLSAQGKSPLVFTLLIANYLEGDVVSEIILKSASYNSRADEFKVEMEGVFTK